jgi:hypothetical protein
MSEDVELWTWLLFASGLPTLRAKELLRAWQAAGLQPQKAIEALPAGGPHLGVSPSEARQLAEAFRHRGTPPGSPVPAMTWDAPTYPAGLTALPLRLQPALLFYRGDPDLLDRMVVYLPPGELPTEDQESVREAVSLLLGEHLLIGVYQDSPQADLVLEEMAAAEGEVLLFARSGLASGQPAPIAEDHRLSARVLIVSPLPPAAPQLPAWDAVLQQVALAAADRVVLTGRADEITVRTLTERPKPTMALLGATGSAPVGVSLPPNARTAPLPADVLDWIADTTLALETHASESGYTYVGCHGDPKADFALGQPETTPPPSPEEILATLKKGGSIPEALRRRLLGDG